MQPSLVIIVVYGGKFRRARQVVHRLQAVLVPRNACVNPSPPSARSVARAVHVVHEVSNGKRVLVVDDDLPLAHHIAQLLAPLGLRIEVAGTAKDALDRVAQQPFDVVLLDIKLPDGCGVELGAQLHERAPDAELVFVTGHASAEAAVKAVGQNAAAMLLKPFDPNALVESVTKALHRKRDAGRALANRVRESRMQTLTRLSVGLAHELRNPLNSALLQMKVAMRRRRAEQESASDAVTAHIGAAADELHRLSRIVTEFEACVQPAVLSLEDVTPEELFDGIGDCAPHIAVQRDVEPGIVLRIDRERLQTALAKLVQNALEAMREHGTLYLRALRRDGIAVLEVEDTGVGIASVEPIFDPYYSTKQFGTGLGLTVVQRIVADHGGVIDVTSHPGSTVFAISLPCAAA